MVRGHGVDRMDQVRTVGGGKILLYRRCDDRRRDMSEDREVPEQIVIEEDPAGTS